MQERRSGQSVRLVPHCAIPTAFPLDLSTNHCIATYQSAPSYSIASGASISPAIGDIDADILYYQLSNRSLISTSIDSLSDSSVFADYTIVTGSNEPVLQHTRLAALQSDSGPRIVFQNISAGLEIYSQGSQQITSFRDGVS